MGINTGQPFISSSELSSSKHPMNETDDLSSLPVIVFELPEKVSLSHR